MEAKSEEGVLLSDNEIRDKLITLFLAGHETTANSLSWLWYRLAKHPDVEKAVNQELGDLM